MTILLEETHGEGLEEDPSAVSDRQQWHAGFDATPTLDQLERISEVLSGIKSVKPSGQIEFL